MADHGLAEVAPVLNPPAWPRRQWAATCTCGHVEIGLFRGHAVEYYERHVARPESAPGANDG